MQKTTTTKLAAPFKPLARRPFRRAAAHWLFFYAMVLAAAPLWTLETPGKPNATVVGEPGETTVAYWVAAEAARGRVTDLSKPAIVKNAPETLSKDRRIEVMLQPVDGAARYHVLKTAVLPTPGGVEVKVGKPGDKTFYYWIAARNVWRFSALGGPYPAENCAEAAGNTLSWDAVPNATAYDVFRTRRPEPPRGFGMYMIGNAVKGTKWRDRGKIGTSVAGHPATPAAAKPQGNGFFLLASSGAKGLTVADTGQALQPFVAPSINATRQNPVTMPAARQANVRTPGRPGMIQIEQRQHARSKQPTFGTGAVALKLDQKAEAGGHSDYPGIAPRTGGKSNHQVAEFSQSLHVATQAMVLGGYQRGYGTGDMIWFSPHLTYFGSNNDAGDEGVYPIRQSVGRGLNNYRTELAETAEAGATQLTLSELKDGRYGTERLVVNHSQAHRKGRIRHVGNVDVHGKNTEWTADMEGCWISFDVDTIHATGGNRHQSADHGQHRMWYQISEVSSPTKLTIIARTGWSLACNLGYSRWIYDPEERDHPSVMFTNSLAIRNLPKERWKAAREGGYVIAPGTLLGDPWNAGGKRLNIAPLGRPWQKGDKIEIVAGPQAWIGGGRIMMGGEYLPQDVVKGFSIVNNGGRKTNGAALQISHAGSEGFADGINMTLAKDGHGNGLVISAASGWDKQGLPAGTSGVQKGAIVVPDGLPGIIGEHINHYPHIRWDKNTDKRPGALRLQMRNGTEVASFDRTGETRVRDLTVTGDLRGNAQTRGKAVFDGDGERTAFEIRFPKPLRSEPFVTVSTNQFANHRLVSVTREAVTVAFREAPEAGTDNVTIYWLAQQ